MEVFRLPHVWVDHEVRGICFDDGACAGFAYYMGLERAVRERLVQAGWRMNITMSQPNFADAMAEK